MKQRNKPINSPTASRRRPQALGPPADTTPEVRPSLGNLLAPSRETSVLAREDFYDAAEPGTLPVQRDSNYWRALPERWTLLASSVLPRSAYPWI